MAKNLVIVESPAKAKTIEKFLGSDFVVKSSFGHVRDLAKKGLSVDVENNFEPTYEVTSDKKSVIKDLKDESKKAETVWLASDEDREGEAISWHLFEALKLKEDQTRRITFNEITETAIKKAIQEPRTIDINLVDAQQARRVLDRLVGFELSPVLWKKVKPSLSAGRVQSVAVRLLVEREKEILVFVPSSSFKVVALFQLQENKILKAELNHKFKTAEEAEAFLGDCADASFEIGSVAKKPAKKTPAAPFTTSTLQQEASTKLGYSVSKTMTLAQKLYESGRITYMRTDSVNLSDLAVSAAKNEIESRFGEEYSESRKFVTKAKGAQEAHEAIRPTDMSIDAVTGDSGEVRLYELIWKRTLASQMADAQLERTTVKINISKSQYLFQATGEVIKFEGFLKVYLESSDEDEEESGDTIIPPLNEGQQLSFNKMDAIERFTRHAARFTEASLVKELERLGIGRPSTYAPTISTIQKRGYVSKEEKEGTDRNYIHFTLEEGTIKKETKTERTGHEKNKLSPTDIGIVVNDFLVEHFKNIMDYNFTASVEKQFDDIAKGQLKWTEMLSEFYKPFHSEVENTLESAGKASGERHLGEHPESGKRIITRIGRFGPMIQIGEQDDEDKPQFASLQKNQSINTITLEEALELFKLPRSLGEYEEKEVTVAIGRFGPYVKHDSKFISLKVKEGDDPMTLELDRAIILIEEKKEADKNKFIKVFEEDDKVQVLNGRYGPYIKIGKKNFKIPKDQKPEELSLEKCYEISKNQPVKKGKK